MNSKEILPKAAKQRLVEGAIALHTLPEAHFSTIHIPGACNACVYEMTFLDSVRTLDLETDREIIVYGSSDRSRDAEMGAQKLTRAGYTNVFILKGGLQGWQEAGLPVEGEEQDAGSAATEVHLADGDYRLDPAASLVGWAGRNQNSKHWGTLKLTEGHVQVEGRSLRGKLVVDMLSMENSNLEGDELQPVLIAHLQSDDFFDTDEYPTATFTIEAGRIAETPYPTSTNCTLAGRLELHGVSRDLEFAATLTPRDDDGIDLEAHFDLDRTSWDIIYGSARFFEYLGMHTVFEAISLELRLVLQQA